MESLKKWNKRVFRILDLNIEKSTVKDLNNFEGFMVDTDVDYLKRKGQFFFFGFMVKN
jgi:hypothetical protein